MSPAPSSRSSSSSSRWCPTPEQVMILEELYKRGVRTPNASQIQKITAHLSYYGNIQGKNVFYWFQNHKARDRQKLRKKLAKIQQLQQQNYSLYPPLHHHHHHHHQTHFFPFHHYFSNSNYLPPPPPPPHEYLLPSHSQVPTYYTYLPFINYLSL
ncbi:hypothetical protein ACJIZ3_012614 [Penstemon smallii]|uniref:Protein WUSCHEL n=1 Tax=Penstemon smallii TaxID=265156 RepID=A0ABD3UR60_9LAMI